MSLSLAGCGVGNEPSVSSVQMAALTGQVHGGVNPVIGATVNLYETQVGDGGVLPASTYGTAGKLLASTSTDGGGSFSFPTNSTYSCDTAPYMQYAYLVVSGGNTGGNGANANSVFVTALGPCSNLSVAQRNNVHILVSEATTVAAAYALGQFVALSATNPGSSLPVAIGAPSTNDLSSANTGPACSGTGTGLSCTSNGLGHAFQTAMALANGVSIGGSLPSGQFNASMPGYAGSVIPQAMLNIVANALQVCINSNGASSSGCSTLFTDTTVNSVAPTDAFAAAVNLARNPVLPAANGANGIFSGVSATSFFQPNLAAAPTDYSLGIFYPGTVGTGASTASNFPAAFYVALDTADTVYILAGDTSTPTKTGLAALGYGTNGPSLSYGYGASSSNALSAGLTSPGTLAVDSASNVYATNFVSTPANSTIREFAGASGSVSTTIAPSVSGTAVPYERALAVDRSNNLYMATTTGTGTTAPATASGIYQVPSTGTITSDGLLPLTNNNGFSGIAIDANQNVFGCGIGIAGGSSRAAGFVPGSSALVIASPAAAPTAITAGTPYETAVVRSQGFVNAGVFIDANDSFYCPVQHAIAQVSPTTSPTLTLPNPGFEQVYTAATASSPSIGTTLPTAAAGGEADGVDNFFIAANEQAGMLYMLNYLTKTTSAATPFVGGANAPTRMDPCLPQASGSALYCSSNTTVFGTAATYLLGFAAGFQIDSTGSVWVPVGANSANTTGSPNGVVQVIGPAAPTVPQLSTARAGVRP